jgi:uncharacterized protein (TIGR04255 family)
MTEIRHLDNAPIKEALIDLQVVLPDKTDTEELISLYEQFKDDYPDKKALNRREFGFHFDEGQQAKTTIDQSVIGYRFASADEKQVLQYRKNGFTFSRLDPYQDWEQMRDEALKLWEIYVNSISPSLITRLATRYINVIELSYNSDLSEYLTAPPTVPKGLSNEIRGFLTSVEIYEPTIDARGLITQTLEKLPEDKISIVLDIDVSMYGQYKLEDDKYLECLEQLHNYKNKVFFASLTEKAMELFE